METNTDMLRGRVDIFVLKALSIQDGYGYDILNYIHDKTEGHYEMKQSSIYSVLKRLEKQGYIYSYEGTESNGAKRRYYSLADAGRKMLADEEKEWEYTRTLLDNLVSDKTFDLISDTPPFHPSDLRPLTRRSVRSETEDDYSSEQIPVENAEESQAIDNSDVMAETSACTDDTELTTDEVATEAPQAETNILPTVDAAAENNEVVEPVNLQSDIVKNIPREETSIYDKIALNATAASTFDKPASKSSNYREFFGELFTREEKKVEPPADSVDIDCSHINDLRNHLEREGIKLRSYEPTNAGKGLVNYVLVNKLYRDSVALSYLFMVAMLLIVYLCKSFQVSLAAFLSVLAIFLIAPLVATLIWVNAKDRKKKDNYNIKAILAVSGIVYLTFFVVNLIINLIIPDGKGLNSPATYAPSIIFLVVPFFAGIFSILYSTRNYHLKSV